MRTVAVYNMKGGVGKTTTAVNLSYLAAAAGHRTLLWDLDPQAASSFAFRVRPRVSGFGKKSLEDGQALGAAIKETDYNNLHLLPADFAYRKFERFFGSLGKPEPLVTSLLDTLGREFDVVFLDCPAGFSLLTEGVFAAADAILVPTIPTVLSLRTVARLIKWAGRSDAQSTLAAFFSMVDRRKALHRRACEWSAAHSKVFLSGQIPYASVVEQMGVRRMPLAVFAPGDPATAAFAEIWAELQMRLQDEREGNLGQRDRWVFMLQAIEMLIAQLESVDGPAASCQVPAVDGGESSWARERRDLADSQSRTSKRDAAIRSMPEEGSLEEGDISFVHSFDTECRDLERCGHVLELRERKGSLLIVAGRSGSDDVADMTRRAQARIDGSWAMQILSGEMSPFAALERRLGQPGPRAVESIRAIVGGRKLQRIETRVAKHSGSEDCERPYVSTGGRRSDGRSSSAEPHPSGSFQRDRLHRQREHAAVMDL
jgi:cellulose biosynthesis protein BcsQ